MTPEGQSDNREVDTGGRVARTREAIEGPAASAASAVATGYAGRDPRDSSRRAIRRKLSASGRPRKKAAPA